MTLRIEIGKHGIITISSIHGAKIEIWDYCGDLSIGTEGMRAFKASEDTIVIRRVDN